MDKEILQEAGLTSNEATVYTVLLEMGKAHVGEIADRTGLHRRTIYDCLERLLKKGLASSVIEKKTRYFSAVQPAKLVDIIEEKKEKIQEILPALVRLSQQAKEKSEVTVFKGNEGIKSICDDLLRSREKNWLSLSSSGKGPQIMPLYFANLHKRRTKQKMKLTIIYNDDSEGKKRGKELSKMPLTEVKYISSRFVAPISIWVYKNKTAFLVWSALLGILIENKETSESFRNYFSVLWEAAKNS